MNLNDFLPSKQIGKLLSLTAVSLLAVSCLSNSVSSEGEGEGEGEVPDITTKPVAPDGVLEAVTWNLEWYDSTSNGPGNESLQTENIVKVMDSLKADLYAFQEVYDQAALNSLTQHVTGYRGFVAEHIDWVQKTAFVFNSETIDSVSSGAITEGQDEYNWAGRFPLYFEFNYTYQQQKVPVFAVVIHAKANTGDELEQQESYNRRAEAAQSLYTWLQAEKPDAHIILLGDFNDDVDVSIYDNSSPSPYEDFVSDNAGFDAVTSSISQAGQSSYVGGDYTDLIDHIIISNELFGYYVASSEEIFFEAQDMTDFYETTTSDHLPVWAKFDITAQAKRGNE